ncbi:MAG: SRPBCC family protein [Solirubrobacteraceae bacterium]
MAAVEATRTFPGSVADAEARWYDTSRWSQWVDGLERVEAVDPAYPAAGAAVTWVSGPAGRGRVSERVIEHAPGAGQTVDVQDGAITGRQIVAFATAGDAVSVTLALEYRLRRRSPVTLLLDVLFVRRAMAQSLERTLSRFVANA